MRIVFAGTPDFARIALEALLAQGFDVPLVMTQPDRPAGRGMKLSPSPVKQAAVNANIPVLQPHSLRLDGKYPEEAAQARQTLLDLQPDLMVVAAYGLILPKWTLELPRYGCFNIHASLLPRWRGAAPIQRAIQAGDAATGITIMQMDEGLDTGDMLVRSELTIRDDHSAATLHDDLAQLGAQALLEALQQVRDGTLEATPQPEEGVTYAEKLSKAESVLDLGQPAKELERRIRAFDPVPGSTLSLPGLEQPVKVWRAQALEQKHSAEPGEVLNVSAQGIDVACGEGVLRLLELQKAGSKRQPVAVFVQGWQSR
ncbi:methionyl-tRNA formyltransferase [Alcaligenes faecalis]|uniref:methionyl-tRNA formyltransferase n=1 Tax=Alcaligenes faecalis TaxID=511 RepID=UPI0005A8F459|nr:methionyl-tRNA formyltransferase [Alcaligenes faecalis]ATI01656.1 methionyl-tRNA formyltransferase [Alcaligenes faecalis]AYZ91013.1 methionyl-tRNA formyltransferase [Alcaligenes faecalis]MCX5594687.1 methionyl-tRNA formyltransferase [Alcaligenes faecalis]QQC33173.1 methionyl-tRNA formyltransferase [Alcaligenes faecalis]CAJ0889836.1 10-formyltetrahydrofolate:L-methionyl-tRNA(fMet) N-formyltransferase [Alcaligenes faecalis subsp. faecalis]